MVSSNPTFRDYVEKLREYLKNKYGEDLMETISDDYYIDELKTFEVIINDNTDYEDALIFSLDEDIDGNIIFEVGRAITRYGIYEFDDIQARIQRILKKIHDKVFKLHDERRLVAISRPFPQTELEIRLGVGVNDYAIFHTDDVGNRWSAYLPYLGFAIIFRSRPSLTIFEEIIKQADNDLILDIVEGWLRDYVSTDIDELAKTIEDSWERYNKLMEDYAED